jgi:hypothetical protein
VRSAEAEETKSCSLAVAGRAPLGKLGGLSPGLARSLLLKAWRRPIRQEACVRACAADPPA